MRRWLGYWIGRDRINRGYCPRCNSSPPDPDCPVCDGYYGYGPGLALTQRAFWRMRWDRLNGRTA